MRQRHNKYRELEEMLCNKFNLNENRASFYAKLDILIERTALSKESRVDFFNVVKKKWLDFFPDSPFDFQLIKEYTLTYRPFCRLIGEVGICNMESRSYLEETLLLAKTQLLISKDHRISQNEILGILANMNFLFKINIQQKIEPTLKRYAEHASYEKAGAFFSENSTDIQQLFEISEEEFLKRKEYSSEEHKIQKVVPVVHLQENTQKNPKKLEHKNNLNMPKQESVTPDVSDTDLFNTAEVLETQKKQIKSLTFILEQKKEELKRTKEEYKYLQIKLEQKGKEAYTNYHQAIFDLVRAMNEDQVFELLYASIQKEEKSVEEIRMLLENMFASLKSFGIYPDQRIGEVVSLQKNGSREHYRVSMYHQTPLGDQAKVKFPGWKYKEKTLLLPMIETLE